MGTNESSGKPELLLTDASFAQVRERLYEIAHSENGPPSLFQANGSLVRIRRIGDSVTVQRMDCDMIRSWMDEHAKITRVVAKDKRNVVLPLMPRQQNSWVNSG
jgi:hypothetical protein